MSIKLTNVIKKDLKKVLDINILYGLRVKGKVLLKMIKNKSFITNQSMHFKMEGLKVGLKNIIRMFLFRVDIEYGELNLVVK